MSKAMTYIGDGAFDVASVSGVSIVDKNKPMMYRAYHGTLPIHPDWYELPLSTYRTGYLSVVLSCGKEHDARD